MQINVSATSTLHSVADTVRISLRVVARAATIDDVRVAHGADAAAFAAAIADAGAVIVERNMTVTEGWHRPSDDSDDTELSYVAVSTATLEGDAVGAADTLALIQAICPAATVSRIAWSISPTNPIRTAAYQAAAAELQHKARMLAACIDRHQVVATVVSDRPIESSRPRDETAGAMMLGRSSGAADDAPIVSLEPPTLSVSASLFGVFSAV